MSISQETPRIDGEHQKLDRTARIFPKSTGGKHKALGPNLALHRVLSGQISCFYSAAMWSSLPLVKE